MLDEDERRIFNFDPRTINWKMLTELNGYGI
jgi:hypothetical protein